MRFPSGSVTTKVRPKTTQVPRCSEVGLMVARSTAAVDEMYASWVGKGVTVVEEPHDEVADLV